MPISYRIDESRQRVYSRAEGVLTYAELRAHMNEEEGQPAASYSELFDCSEAITNITAQDVRQLAGERQGIAGLQQAGPIAIAATNDNLYGMLRMYDALTEQVRPIRVFRTAPEAERWLDEVTGRQSVSAEGDAPAAR